MPSTDRFVTPNESSATRLRTHLRQHPMAILIGAAAGGALLGGVLVYQSTGSQRGTPARLAETTGAATPVARAEQPAVQEPAKESAVDCEQQTWPHLSHECAEQKRRSVRVITTDKLSGPTVNAIEASPPASATVPPMNPALAAKPAPTPSAAASIASTPALPIPSRPAPTVASTPAPMVTATASAQPASTATAPAPPSPLTPAAQVGNVEPSAPQPSPPAAAAADHPKDVGKKSKRKKAKSRDRSIDEDTRSGERREGRIVERWTERDYDVSSDDRSGRRKRVTVIERGNGRSERTSERSERREDSFFGLFRF